MEKEKLAQLAEEERVKLETAKREQNEKDMEQMKQIGWKPCPMRCKAGGGVKNDDECDHMTCHCGFEFCWQCGVERKITLVHDNRWHKPSCKYWTPYDSVQEEPKYNKDCPACVKLGRCCDYPADDGYPESYMVEYFMNR